MNHPPARQTVVLVAGLPYSGKTTIVNNLIERLPGSAIFIDEIFRELVSEEEVCLERWLAEGAALVARIIDAIQVRREPYIYVEIGILQPHHRGALADWIRNHDYRLVSVLLYCGSDEAVRERQAQRATSLAVGFDKVKIAIDLEELYGPISSAFVWPRPEEGFHTVDTSRPIRENISDLCGILQ